LIGAGIGLMLGLRGMRRAVPMDLSYPLLGVLLGAIGGGLVWLIDVPPGEGKPASAIGSLFAVLALCLGCMPVAGLVFSVPAFLLNRRVAGWQNRASRWGLGLGVVLTLVIVFAMSIIK
jgi:hypothetical protein